MTSSPVILALLIICILLILLFIFISFDFKLRPSITSNASFDVKEALPLIMKLPDPFIVPFFHSKLFNVTVFEPIFLGHYYFIVTLLKIDIVTEICIFYNLW